MDICIWIKYEGRWVFHCRVTVESFEYFSYGRCHGNCAPNISAKVGNAKMWALSHNNGLLWCSVGA